MSRVKIHEVQPKAYEAMFGLEKYIETVDLPAILVELVRIRASQINGCAFCIHLHSQAAQKNGETVERLLTLPAWRESALFSIQERTVLALTEEATLISDHGVSDRVYGNLLAHFDEQQIAQLIVLIAAINAWNRIAVSTHVQ